MDFGPKNYKAPLNLIESRRNQGKLEETLEKHGCQTQNPLKKKCCRHWKREAGGWGGSLAADDVGGGGASSESTSRALMRRHVRNNLATEKWRMGDLLLELLPSVGRSSASDPSGVVVGRS